MSVSDIADYRPHSCIIGPMNEPHIVPVECIRRMITGENKLINEGQEEIDEDMIRGIFTGFLQDNGYEV